MMKDAWKVVGGVFLALALAVFVFGCERGIGTGGQIELPPEEAALAEGAGAAETAVNVDQLMEQLQALQDQINRLTAGEGIPGEVPPAAAPGEEPATPAEPGAPSVDLTPSLTGTRFVAYNVANALRPMGVPTPSSDSPDAAVPQNCEIIDVFLTFETADIAGAGTDSEQEVSFCKDNTMNQCLRFYKIHDFHGDQLERNSVERYSVSNHFDAALDSPIRGKDCAYLQFFNVKQSPRGIEDWWGISTFKVEAEMKINGVVQPVATIYSNPCVNKIIKRDNLYNSISFSLNDVAVCIGLETARGDHAATDDNLYVFFPATKNLDSLNETAKMMIVNRSNGEPYWTFKECGEGDPICTAGYWEKFAQWTEGDGYNNHRAEAKEYQYGGYFFNTDVRPEGGTLDNPVGTDPVAPRFMITKEADRSGDYGWIAKKYDVQIIRPGDPAYINKTGKCWGWADLVDVSFSNKDSLYWPREGKLWQDMSLGECRWYFDPKDKNGVDRTNKNITM